MEFSKNILCIGAGYVGGPTMAVIAAHCPQYKVTVVDIDHARILAWRSDRLPIYEPGLDEVVKRARGRNLFFSPDIGPAIRAADVIFVAVNTPTKTFGHGAGRAPDLRYWEDTARHILHHAERDTIVVEKSTLPVRTAEAMLRILNANTGGIRFEVVSNPEFLAEGNAIRDLENPDRILVGSRETPEGIAARKAVVDIYTNWVPRQKIIESNVWSAELAKLAANALLAQRVSSINALSALCEKTGADVDEVAHAVGRDGRIGSRFLKAGPGFGGSCFKKDILHLAYICEIYDLPEAAAYWTSVVDVNEWQQRRFVRAIMQHMFETVAGKRIAVLGGAFKADTGDTRESPALSIVRGLLDERAQVVLSDPRALDNARAALHDLGDAVAFEPDPYAAADGAHALAVVTEWEEYRTLDYARILAGMHRPAFLFDGRNILDHPRLFEMGFNVVPIGKPALTHF